MLTDKNIELFKKCFIDNESSIKDLILVKHSLTEFRDKEVEKILSKFIDEKVSILKNTCLLINKKN